MTKAFLRAIYIIIASSVFTSCKTESELFCFYSASEHDRDVSVLISYSDSTYLYSNSLHSSEIDYKEIGRVKIIKDSIFFSPACKILSDTSFNKFEPYDCENSKYATLENGEVKTVCIKRRVYIKEKESIIDKTLESYFPNDSNAFSLYESYPLEKRKINANKEEKFILRWRDRLQRCGICLEKKRRTWWR